MSSTNGEQEGRSNAKSVRLAGYLAIGLLAVFLIELLSFSVSKYAARYGVFFDKSIISQNYQDYISKRNMKLGWLPREADRSGARKDPSEFASTEPCVDVYGDSFTWGDEVGDGDAWPSLLTSSLKCRVRNFGVGGYGTDQAYLRFESVTDHSPVVVINHLSENIIRNVNQFRNFIYPGMEYVFKPRFDVAGAGTYLIETPDVPPEKLNEFLEYPREFLTHEYFLPGGRSGVQFIEFPYTWGLLKSLGHWHVRSWIGREVRHADFYETSHPSHALQITGDILTRFVSRGVSKGVTPLVSIIPTCRDFEYLERNNRFPYDGLVTQLNEKGLAVIDVGREIYSKVGKDYRALYFTCSSHFNPKGNRLMAEIVSDHLKRLGVTR